MYYIRNKVPKEHLEYLAGNTFLESLAILVKQQYDPNAEITIELETIEGEPANGYRTYKKTGKQTYTILINWENDRGDMRKTFADKLIDLSKKCDPNATVKIATQIVEAMPIECCMLFDIIVYTIIINKDNKDG